METSERPRPRWREWLCQAEVLLVLPCAVITAAWLSPLGGVTGHALIVAAFLAPGLIRGRVQRGFCYLVLAFGLMLAAPFVLVSGLGYVLGPCGLIYLCLGLGLFFGRLLPRVLAWFVLP